ncbi:NAD(P)H-dependent oxidoreductase [Mucilaginibacter sp. Bleaf8]|uniref:NAD(P)H-dependent oxidoreductase n=1 Tax=Mucilaginibacter sp. Bleaf8 TaxID=2834430 RepID=UPI001BCACF8F|nr:NAD(P)H-dependent oxidoreductase [Mucilaginibacter sp. Bleaf8]MBS7566492.1 NAD(P)H-dependent oxidoreductase [Mucilaginibacter sp. Bleaf8]
MQNQKKKIFVINGGQIFGHSGGRFNKTVFEATKEFFSNHEGFEIRATDINKPYTPEQEVEHFVWADTIIYHTPIWWFQLPHGLKKYIDEVFTAGYRKGIYYSDGRKADNPKINYGTGGTMHGRNYLLTTSWNAPKTAFTLPGEFFNQKSVDEGALFGFHRMNAFTGLTPLESLHFHDVEKNADINKDLQRYQQHLEKLFLTTKPDEPVQLGESIR